MNPHDGQESPRETFERTRQDPSGRERTVTGTSNRFGQDLEPQEEFISDGVRADGNPEPRPRTTAEVFHDHQGRLRLGDLDGDFRENYSESVVLVTGTGIHHGREEARQTLEALDRRLTGARLETRSCFVEGELVFLEWEARTPSGEHLSAVETYVIRSSRIVAQTVHYEAE